MGLFFNVLNIITVSLSNNIKVFVFTYFPVDFNNTVHYQ
ncbi:MAG: hypothetical protein BSOLF_2099 [Candidatus Carbobacillus altaicus]|uniref:Uncharacterized protein n=1 Tax=Candidatus Carbonibacillus altaicus TaxID=2163959 RepID=A0A2R6XYF7_9BACL|nr:MAG: hypothetical protein BSOLF_2099 [Candidatus Carbobacillus altaicus]